MNETKFLHSRTFLHSEKGQIDMLRMETGHRAPAMGQGLSSIVLADMNKSSLRKWAFRKCSRRIISGTSVSCDRAGGWKLECSLSTQELSA